MESKEALRKYFSAFCQISEELWSYLDGIFLFKELKPNQYFARNGEYSKRFAFLESGCVRAFFTNPSGKEYNKQFFVGPTLIGAYSSLLTGQKNMIPQQALTPCRIWVADYQRITEGYRKYPQLETISRLIAEMYFLEKEKKEIALALDDAEVRYLDFRKQFPGLEQAIPQYHIASYLSITPTQLSRIRKKLTIQSK